MDEMTTKQALDVIAREKRRYKNQNDWITANRERQTVTLPKGTKEKIKILVGESVNGYINKLIADDLKRREALRGEG